MEWRRANAMASVAVQLGSLLKRAENQGPTLPPPLVVELRELLGHVRSRLLP